MALKLYPMTSGFAAEVGDLDLAAPLAPADLAAIKQAFWDYAVLIFPEQELTEQQHVAFARYFGPLEDSVAALTKNPKLRIRSDLADVSNLNAHAAVYHEQSRRRGIALGNRLWHTDSSFKFLPARASLLYARQIPPAGGHTEFADLRAAWDALAPAMQQRLEGLTAEHSLIYSRARIGFTNFTEEERVNLAPAWQVLVRTLPENRRRSLYLAAHAGRIAGMPEAAGRALIDQLLAHATARQFVYAHRWRLHDLVMWDNRCTMHRGTEFEDLRFVRDMHRATVSDIANSCVQAGVAIPTNEAPGAV